MDVVFHVAPRERIHRLTEDFRLWSGQWLLGIIAHLSDIY